MAKLLVLTISSLIISGCFNPVDFGNRSFVGAAGIGDLVQVDINKDQIKLQYDSRTGGILSGTLQVMPKSDNQAYRLKEKPGVRVVMVPDDLVVYATDKGYGKFGVGVLTRRMTYNAEDLAGMYNFISRYREERWERDRLSFGTFEINTDNTWRSWKMVDGSQDLYAPTRSGTWADKGDGTIQVFLDDGQLFATLVISQGSSENLMVIYLTGRSGVALGLKKNVLKPGSFDGDYAMLCTKDNVIKRPSLRDEVITCGKKQLAIVYNQPWEGFIKDNRGEFLGLISSKGTFFGVNIGALSGTQFMFAAVKNS